MRSSALASTPSRFASAATSPSALGGSHSPPEQHAAATPHEEHGLRRGEHDGHATHGDGGSLRRGPGQRFCDSALEAHAKGPDRTIPALGLSGQAHRGAELHEGLVPVAGIALAHDERLGDAPQARATLCGLHVLLDGEEPRQDARHVPVNHRRPTPERDARDGARRVGSDAGETPQVLDLARERAAVEQDDLLGRGLQHAGAPVIPEPAPLGGEHALLRRFREIAQGR